MSRQPSPRELYPNLFGEKPAAAKPSARRHEDLRLLSWNALQTAARRKAKRAEVSASRPTPRMA